MTGWTADELEKIESADELEIASLRPDGTLGSQRTIWVGGVEKDVTFVEADADIEARTDDAYREKYRRFAKSIVDSTLTPQARSAALKLVPQE